MFVGLKVMFKNIQYDFFKWCRNSELKCAVLRPLISFEVLLQVLFY